MQADSDDRVTSEERGRHSTQTLVTAVAVLILAGGAYLLAPKGDDEPAQPASVAEQAPDVPAITPPKPQPVTAIAEAPDIPEATPEPDSAPQPVAESPAAPPTPEELDAELRAALDEIDFDPAPAVAGMLDAPYLLDRGVSSLDQLARGLVPRRTLNIARPAGNFGVRQDGATYSVDPDAYQRYDALVAGITEIPITTSVAFFSEFRTLLRDAYAALGYPADMMDNTLIAALDAVIAAPVREEPPALASKGALWAYADEDLENASDLHKQLLRLGPKNTRALQRWATELRDALLTR